MSNTIEFVGVTLVLISLSVLSFVAGASPVLDLSEARFAALMFDTIAGTLIGVTLMLVGLRRGGLDGGQAVAVISATVIVILAVVYIPVVLFIQYLPTHTLFR